MTAIRKFMTPEEFLAWCLDQDGRWELVSGMPAQMMTGASRDHDDIVINLLAMLKARLRGGECRPTTDDTASRMPNGNLRRPDVTIECGPRIGDSLESSEPAAFFEVLSPTTRSFDLVHKQEEYRQVPSLRHIVMLDPKRARAWVWSRTQTGWETADLVGLSSTISLSHLNLHLPIADIYDGVSLEE